MINAGEIVEQGAHNVLMAKKGFYYTLYMSQFKGKAPGGEKATAELVASKYPKHQRRHMKVTAPM